MFVIWGAIHGFYQLHEKATFNFRARLWKLSRLDGTWIQWLVKWIVTMGVVLISWVFFRSTSLEEVIQISSLIARDMLDGSLLRGLLLLVQRNQIGLGIGPFRLVVILISIVTLETVQVIMEYYSDISKKIWSINFLPSIAFQVLILWILLFGQFGLQEFIYFQF
jgi:D-alanyl-lipoteichoic acid acyltransferase DltB (MBOAT superfamily)